MPPQPLAPRSQEGSSGDGDPQPGELPVQDPDTHVGTCGATGDAVFPAPAWAGFRRTASPCTLPGATEPEVTRSWRRRPGRRRDVAAERDRKVSRKREAQVQKHHLLPAPHPLEASPPWAGGSWSRGRRAELSGPGGWGLEAVRSCTWGRSLSAQAWASL